MNHVLSSKVRNRRWAFRETGLPACSRGILIRFSPGRFRVRFSLSCVPRVPLLAALAPLVVLLLLPAGEGWADSTKSSAGSANAEPTSESILESSASFADAEDEAGRSVSPWYGRIGMDFSRGRYGTVTEGTVLYVPLTLGYTASDSTWVEVRVPYLQVRTTDRDSVGDTGETPSSAAGIGDVLVSVSHAWTLSHGLRAPWYLDATLWGKLPTADPDRDLGTGKADFTLEAAASRMVGRWSLGGTASWTRTGRTSDYNVRDGWSVAPVVQVPVSAISWLGLSVGYARATVESFDDSLDVVLFLNQYPSRSTSSSVYLLGGLSDGSPDVAIGWSLTFALP